MNLKEDSSYYTDRGEISNFTAFFLKIQLNSMSTGYFKPVCFDFLRFRPYDAWAYVEQT